jgi:hypothetical protein
MRLGRMTLGRMRLSPRILAVNGLGITLHALGRLLACASGDAEAAGHDCLRRAQLFEPLRRHDRCVARDDTAICGARTAGGG